MKKHIKILSVLSVVIGMLYLPACIDYDFAEPEKATYNPDIEANTTIEELKDLYTGELTLIEDDVVIKGTVIAN
ncbi:MAG: hypothetical protein GXO50_01685, partial [Chlorobi bacterium]|nr:hypothetical protein [Chlorobiota bacterium]